MKKIVITCLWLLLVSAVIVFVIVYIVNNVDFTNKEPEKNNYIQNMTMDYIEKDDIQIKVDYLSMTKTNLDIVFNVKFREDTSNYEGVSVQVLITDEEGRQIFIDTEQEEVHSKNYAKVMGSRPIENQDNTIRQLLFLTARDNFPDSKKLYISFDTVTLYNVNQGNPFTKEFKGDWKLEIDV